ncbi:MAG TPA: hypothetical protein VKU84_13390, partial [Stellaceae bacterium]|nr:hypothetical protein [Stellaceae bacterium]
DQFLHFVHEQRPQVFEALKKERKLRVDAQKQPDDDRINEAIRAFQPQFKPAPTSPLERPKDAIKQAETAVQARR